MMMRNLTYENTGDITTHSFCVFTSCDSKYFKLYGVQFVYSLELNSAGSLCILHIINPDDETESIVQEVKNRLQSTTLIIIREMVDLANKTPDYQRTYYACSRYIILPELMKKYQFDIYLSDVDAFIKKDLVLLRKEYVNHDLAIFWRLNIEYTRRLLGGTVYIKNTPCDI